MTGNQSPCEKLMTLSAQKIDMPSNSTKHGCFCSVTKVEIAPEPTFHCARQDLCDKIRNVIGIILYGNLPSIKLPEELRGIEHKKP